MCVIWNWTKNCLCGEKISGMGMVAAGKSSGKRKKRETCLLPGTDSHYYLGTPPLAHQEQKTWETKVGERRKCKSWALCQTAVSDRLTKYYRSQIGKKHSPELGACSCSFLQIFFKHALRTLTSPVCTVFSCPEQLNSWSCHSVGHLLTHSVSHWGYFINWDI